ncbi:putative protein phosphatase 2C-like protein 44 [Coffea arabica]|uniref:PPM-type phosphatase domain-containing protein n=1 Tax=Coffea arabica TaxID=13443 RepID=A0A6P6WK04_COFAR
MGLLDLHLKLKTFRLRRLLMGGEGDDKGKTASGGKRPSWMMPAVSHGYHVAEDRSFVAALSRGLELEPDKVVVQREEIQENELWFFGVFDARIGDGVSKYIQAHLFDKKVKESHMRKKTEDAIKRAHLNVRAKIREAEKVEDAWKVSSATAIVINGEKLVIANMGEYKAVLCRDGKAYQINREKQGGIRRRWSRKFIPGMNLQLRNSLSLANKSYKCSELVVVSERVESDTEFLILASIGIWEVMKHQEAVNLIRHIEDPQEAADCLAKEAVTRMSRSNISCLIIRFD